MRKRMLRVLFFMAAVVMLGGCGNRKGVEAYATPGDYNNLEVVMGAVGVDEEELFSQMNDIYASFVTKERGGIMDRAVQVGDTVNIDYVGKKNEIAFEGGTAQNQLLKIGSGQYIPGFEDGLVGAKPGETVDLNISFPKDYGVEELDGQPVVFTVTVNFIIPAGLKAEEMDSAVITAIGIPSVTNGRELEQYVYDWLYSQYESALQDRIVSMLVDSSTFEEFPRRLIEPYKRKWEKDWKAFWSANEKSFAAYGISMETYLQMGGYKDVDDFITQGAQTDIQRDSVLGAIAVSEGIEVTEDELQVWAQDQAEKYGYDSAEDYIRTVSKDNARKECRNDKVLRYLMDKVTVKQAE